MTLVTAVALTLVTASRLSHAQEAAARRPIRLDDLYNLWDLSHHWGGSAAFSPDGQEVAFVVERPRRTGTPFNTSLLDGNDRADVYVGSTAEGKPVNITHGEADSAGFWAPTWAPDGQRLAMLSTRGGSLQVWSWERTSGALRQLTDSGIDLRSDSAFYAHQYVWLSPTELLIPLPPTNSVSRFYFGNRYSLEEAMPAWQRAWRGTGTSVSAVSSGVSPDLSKIPQGKLAVFDVAAGTHRIIANQTPHTISASPDGRMIAFLWQREIFTPQPSKPMPVYSAVTPGTFALSVIAKDGKLLSAGAAASGLDVQPFSLRWSPDAKELAFIAYPHGATTPRLARWDVMSGTLSVNSLDGLRVDPEPRQGPELVWSIRGWLLYASRSDASATPRLYARRDWWLVGADGSLHGLTERLATVPSKLWREAGRDSYVGLAGGALWRVSPAAAPERITSPSDPVIASIVWPDGFFLAAPDPYVKYDQLGVSVERAGRRTLYLVELTSGRLTPVPQSPAADQLTLMAIAPTSGGVLYATNGTTGLRIFVARRGGASPTQIFEANTFMREVELGSWRRLEYTSLNGEALNAWVLLPPSYDSGKRYPLVTWVYPTLVFGEAPPANWTLFSGGPGKEPCYSTEILAAKGYAVLFPSIPMNPEGEVDDFMLKLTPGVLPAVDKTVELGIADPTRLFVMGKSWGGFTTYGLVTQTNRFKAAVTGAQHVDLISAYGQFGEDLRHMEDMYQRMTWLFLGESQMRFDGPPWRDLGRYLRNSPIFYVDRVQTPVMILQGDMDANGMEQAEEFFSALYRQGKRAELVRYWGEGHIISAEPNVRDMWDRVFAWFEEFSPKPTQAH